VQSIRDNLATIIAGVLVVTALAVVALLFGPWRVPQDRRLAVVVHDADDNVSTSRLDENARLVVDTSLGHNVVVVENGAAHMEEADCPHGDCMRQHAIAHPGEQLICLPHKLWVEVVEEGSSGTAMDTSAVTTDSPDSATPNANKDADLVAR
jgi:hypothetical protein